MNTRSHLQPKPTSSFTPVSSRLLQRKCACGGSAGLTGKCAECDSKRLTLQNHTSNLTESNAKRHPSQHSPKLQAKLTLGDPNDRYEQEADRIADQIVQIPAIEGRYSVHSISKQSTDESIQTSKSVEHGAQVPPEIEARINSSLGGGQPLETSIRAFVEPRFGHNFSHVRIHSEPESAFLAAQVGARAFTIGNDIFMGSGEFQPTQNGGLHLLAHELTHVVQQSETAATATKSGGRSVIRRYGHANSCKDDTHLKPFIWPGHDHAKKATTRAIEELNKDTLHPTAMNELKRLFGQDSTTASNLATIRQKFEQIKNALDEQYLYHCANPCEKPNKGARAWTDKSGNKDITICFDQVTGYTVPAAGWLIIHENVHRGLNVWPKIHPWQPKDFDGCFIGTALSGESLVLDNPDSYACFASRMWFPL